MPIWDRGLLLPHVVGNGEVCTEESKLPAEKAFLTPVTKIRSHQVLPQLYSRICGGGCSLKDITRKNAPNKVQWLSNCTKAFSMLKGLLCSEPILKSPDFEHEFILQTDISGRGIGAVLSQRNDAGVEHPVAFYSRKLLPREV